MTQDQKPLFPALKRVDFSHNKIDQSTAEFLILALYNRIPGLEQIDLSYNPISWEEKKEIEAKNKNVCTLASRLFFCNIPNVLIKNKRILIFTLENRNDRMRASEVSEPSEPDSHRRRIMLGSSKKTQYFCNLERKKVRDLIPG